MTGYAAGSVHYAGLNLSLDLRSVNSRYLEIHFRCGDEFRAIEPLLRERIAQHVQRGKLECRVTLGSSAGADRQLQLNSGLAGTPERIGRGGDPAYAGRTANERGRGSALAGYAG